MSSSVRAGLSPFYFKRAAVTSWIEDATAEFINVTGKEGDCLEPTARNSNLLPVKAKGEVRFLIRNFITKTKNIQFDFFILFF